MPRPRRVKIADERLRSRPLHRKSKDRKRWCKGRVGVEHDWGFWEPGYGPSHTYINEKLGRAGRVRELWAFRVCQTCERVEHFIERLSDLPDDEELWALCESLRKGAGRGEALWACGTEEGGFLWALTHGESAQESEPV